MDRKSNSKYRNEDVPLGYVVKDQPDIKIKGIVIENTQYTIVYSILDCGIFKLHNVDDYSDFEVSSEEEEEEIENAVSIQIKKEAIASDDETKKNDKKHKHKKNGHDNGDSPSLDDNSKSEKEVKIKKENEQEKKKLDYRSESRVKKRLVKYSPSPSPERNVEDVKVKVKEEPIEAPVHLYGAYDCEVCNIKMTSKVAYMNHVNGKKHRKTLRQKNISEAVKQTIPGFATEGQGHSKYPKPPPGVIRIKVKKRAELQDIIERDIKTPCPGLDKVIEIQGIDDTNYYCSMCDSFCSPSSIIPHLTGYKHQLKSIKEFKPGEYERMSFQPKYKIEKEILSILRAVQNKHGIGRIAVEVERLINEDDESSDGNHPSTSREFQRRRTKEPGRSFSTMYNESTIPSTSSPDFHCTLCQSHMNSVEMWEAHIRGKRHLNNLKKLPGDRPSKTKTIRLPHARAKLLDEIESMQDEPFVGLNNIQETQIPEANSQSYNCFLCGSCHTVIDIIDHLISYKHRLKYLEYIQFEGREVVMGWSEAMGAPLVRDMCFQAEEELGRGRPVVHADKSILYK